MMNGLRNVQKYLISFGSRLPADAFCVQMQKLEADVSRPRVSSAAGAGRLTGAGALARPGRRMLLILAAGLVGHARAFSAAGPRPRVLLALPAAGMISRGVARAPLSGMTAAGPEQMVTATGSWRQASVLPLNTTDDGIVWYPGEAVQRATLNAAFQFIDSDNSSTLDAAELRAAGFDAENLLRYLDANEDGKLTREEFVDQLLLQSRNEPALRLSAWELADRLEQRKREENGVDTVWGSAAVRRAINNPRFELISFANVLIACISYALSTTAGIEPMMQTFLVEVQDVLSVAFAVEYLLRWWGNSFSARSLLRFENLIDLVSFLPLVLILGFPLLTGGLPHGPKPPTSLPAWSQALHLSPAA